MGAVIAPQVTPEATVNGRKTVSVTSPMMVAVRLRKDAMNQVSFDLVDTTIARVKEVKEGSGVTSYPSAKWEKTDLWKLLEFAREKQNLSSQVLGKRTTG